ncbi:MAG: peptide chain release factor 2 [Methanoregula sp.]|jgi:peptide chain release factor 2|nr:peptide chain release factor 2 [Methanoregula sp.]
MENLLKNLNDLRERVGKTAELLRLDGMRSELQGLEKIMQTPQFWQDQNKAKQVSQEAAELREEIKKWDELTKKIRDLEELVAVAQKEEKAGTKLDTTLAAELEERFNELETEFNKLEFLVLFGEKYDVNNVILTIHAGTGGTDAQDWAQILERMYLRFAESKKWAVEILERSMGGEAGIKSAMLKISGRWAYGYLKSEAGVHRLVRISPFDAEKMRHTSFALVEIIPELPDTEEVAIKDEDLRIDVFRSSGAGGQSVNTTDSAVRVVHLPTNITVTCQNERSQSQNKETAMKILQAKLFQLEEQKRTEEEAKLRGETLSPEWGSQIRSYVMQPYKMVKDHRTEHETQDVESVLDGKLEEFMESYLRWRASQKSKVKSQK